MIKEFRDFINRGNVVELGVAFVMGASFKSLVDVFTKRLVEPLIGLVLNMPNLDGLSMCKKLKEDNVETAPIMMVTTEANPQLR